MSGSLPSERKMLTWRSLWPSFMMSPLYGETKPPATGAVLETMQLGNVYADACFLVHMKASTKSHPAPVIGNSELSEAYVRNSSPKCWSASDVRFSSWPPFRIHQSAP